MPDFTTPMTDNSAEEDSAELQASLCRQAFDVCLQALIPKLYAARALDDGLLRPFRYCHRTWKDGAVAFRHELLDVSSRWKELGRAGSSPYASLSANELLEHRREFRSFCVATDLKLRLTDLLETDSDGWVPIEAWEATEAAHQKLFRELVQTLQKPENIDDEAMSEEDLKKIWPFDIE